MPFDLDPSYKQVPERIADFKAKHPEGSLRAADPKNPYRVEQFGDATFIVYTAEAWRSPTDPAPGVGVAWERVPGLTPYTKNSELQNAETSAWGRAIVAALASESKSIASAEDVRNRRDEQESYQPPPLPAGWATHDQHQDAWDSLREDTNAIPDEADRESVKSWVKSHRITFGSLTAALADEWRELVDKVTPA